MSPLQASQLVVLFVDRLRRWRKGRLSFERVDDGLDNKLTHAVCGWTRPTGDRDFPARCVHHFGDIKVELPPDPNSHSLHRGFGFVEFEDPADADAAIQNFISRIDLSRDPYES
ncbi:hypothetical protein BJ742DRAFT_198080 [Cladochytrium replicatum]|nr:hypothetical protein BJ742DRAFT_198080 [Cladochytrium replicatum]